MTTSFSPAQGPARERLKADQIRDLQASLVVDHRRRRPLYFDGRFLAARDLVREQQYFLTRQADLGRAGGWGVVEGLFVQRGGTPNSLVIQPGHGVTPAGELVVVSADFTIDLTEIPEIERLNAAFGLMQIPHDPPRNRTGLFVLALRPVEFSANPVASYPTSIEGPRSVEDGEIVEGAVVTLIPYADEGPNVSAWARRARVAHEVFVGGSGKGTAAGALPLAIVALNGGTIEWLDVFVVRREVGSLQADVVGLGFAPRGLREAHLLQYEAHLREVLALRSTLGYAFAATEYFQALPPAGRLPAAAVQPDEFTQRFFPPTVDVDLSIVPEDEIPALVEESLSLSPIDLNRSAEELDSTSVVILVPVPRGELRTISTSISSLTRSLKSAAPGMLARRTPLEHLRGIRLPGNFIPLPDPQEGENARWTELLRRGGMLWYVRRRTLAMRAELEGEQKVAQALLPAASSNLELNRRSKALDDREAELSERLDEVMRRERALETRAPAEPPPPRGGGAAPPPKGGGTTPPPTQEPPAGGGGAAPAVRATPRTATLATPRVVPPRTPGAATDPGGGKAPGSESGGGGGKTPPPEPKTPTAESGGGGKTPEAEPAGGGGKSPATRGATPRTPTLQTPDVEPPRTPGEIRQPEAEAPSPPVKGRGTAGGIKTPEAELEIGVRAPGRTVLEAELEVAEGKGRTPTRTPAAEPKTPVAETPKAPAAEPKTPAAPRVPAAETPKAPEVETPVTPPKRAATRNLAAEEIEIENPKLANIKRRGIP